ERGVDDRLQGSVQDSRWRLLLPPDPARSLQPIFARVPRTVRREDGRRTSHPRARVPRTWVAGGDPQRQRLAVASTGIHGLCALNVWWMKLGIVHQRI